MPRLLAAFLLALCGFGCAHDTGSPPVFTKPWYDKTQAAMTEDKARKEAQGVLLGDENNAVSLRADEEGRPRLQIGKDRVHADLDVKSGDPRVRLRYKLQWGHGEKDMPEHIPRLHPAPESPPESGQPATEDK
ncbi:MAG TPA: hypothetical protein PKW60_02110 [Candidatus Hydrogenedentes bacterium]|nr:hypothetical protein [Candidatus Hydrogenedentota bacterium]